MRLIAALDTLARLPDDRRQVLFGDAWHAMRGLRNRLAHGYIDIDFAVVTSTVDQNVPSVIQTIRRELGNE